MFRAVFLLWCQIVRLSFSVRKGVSNGPDAVLEHVTVLLQQHVDAHSATTHSKAMLEQLRSTQMHAAGNAETPGVKENLTWVVNNLTQHVAVKIQLDHNETQDEINTRFTNVNNSATDAIGTLAIAGSSQFNLNGKVQTEIDSLWNWNNCSDDHDQCVLECPHISNEPECPSESYSAIFPRQPFVCHLGPINWNYLDGWNESEDEVKMQCDDPELKDFESYVSGNLTDLESDMQTKDEEYWKCNNCTQNCTTTYNQTCCNLQGDFWQARFNTETQDAATCRSLNAFKQDRQEYCDFLDSFNNLQLAIDKVNGSVWSEPDRQSEWKAVQLTICILNKFLAGTNLDLTAVQECHDQVNYTTGVGVLNRKRTQVNAINTLAHLGFLCNLSTITIKHNGADLNRWVPYPDADISVPTVPLRTAYGNNGILPSNSPWYNVDTHTCSTADPTWSPLAYSCPTP